MINDIGWEHLKKNDIVDIVAPSGGLTNRKDAIEKVKSYISNLGLIPRIANDFCKTKDELMLKLYDPFCANTDEVRLYNLIDAINSDSKLIWGMRGGYGSTRLIEELKKIGKPNKQKLFIGFSDLTALHLFFNKCWSWPTIHGEVLARIVNSENQMTKDLIENILFGHYHVKYDNFNPLNHYAKVNRTIEAEITGGNLCLVETSIGTCWQAETSGKILFLEEINERGYRVDRSLEHLYQAGMLSNIEAVILGEFTPGYEEDGKNYIQYALTRFINKLNIPVISSCAFGHNIHNYPLPLGTKCKLTLGDKIQIICSTGAKKIFLD